MLLISRASFPHMIFSENLKTKTAIKQRGEFQRFVAGCATCLQVKDPQNKTYSEGGLEIIRFVVSFDSFDERGGPKDSYIQALVGRIER